MERFKQLPTKIECLHPSWKFELPSFTSTEVIEESSKGYIILADTVCAYLSMYASMAIYVA